MQSRELPENFDSELPTWDAGESVDVRSLEGRERARLWLEHFSAHDVTGIGFGFVAIQKNGDDEPSALASF